MPFFYKKVTYLIVTILFCFFVFGQKQAFASYCKTPTSCSPIDNFHWTLSECTKRGHFVVKTCGGGLSAGNSDCAETAAPSCPSSSSGDSRTYNNNAFKFIVQNCAGSRYCYSASSINGQKGNPIIDCNSGKLINLCKGTSSGTSISCNTENGQTISATCQGENGGDSVVVTEKIGFCLIEGQCQYKSESECPGPIYLTKSLCERDKTIVQDPNSKCCCVNGKCSSYNQNTCRNGSWVSQTSCKPDEEKGCNSEYPYYSESIARNSNGKCQYSALYDSKTRCWRRGNSSNGNTVSCSGDYYSSSSLASDGGKYNVITRTVSNVCQSGSVTCYARGNKTGYTCESIGYHTNKGSKSENDAYCHENVCKSCQSMSVNNNDCFLCETEQIQEVSIACGSDALAAYPVNYSSDSQAETYCQNKYGSDAFTQDSSGRCFKCDQSSTTTSTDCQTEGGYTSSGSVATDRQECTGAGLTYSGSFTAKNGDKCYKCKENDCTPSCKSGKKYIWLVSETACLASTGSWDLTKHSETSCNKDITCYECKEKSSSILTDCQAENGSVYSGNEQEAAKACANKNQFLAKTWTAKNGNKCYSCTDNASSILTDCQTEGGYTSSGSIATNRQECTDAGLVYSGTFTAKNGDACYKCVEDDCTPSCKSGTKYTLGLGAWVDCLKQTGNYLSNNYIVNTETSCGESIKCYSCQDNASSASTDCEDEGGYTSSGSIATNRQECTDAGLVYSGTFTAKNGDACYKCVEDDCTPSCSTGKKYTWLMSEMTCLASTGSWDLTKHSEISCNKEITCYECSNSKPSPTPSPTTPPSGGGGDINGGSSSCLSVNSVPTQSAYNATSLSTSEVWGSDTTNSLAKYGPGKKFVASDGNTYYLINGKKDANGNVCSFEKDSNGDYKKNSNGDYIYASDNKCTSLCYARCKYSTTTCANTSCPSGSTCTTTNYSEVVNNQCVDKVCYVVTSSN